NRANLEASQDMILELLQQSIVSPDHILRREAAYATLDLPQISEKLVTALLCGLRDPLPELAEACYWSLARKQSLELNDFLSGLMVTSLQLALQNTDKRVRRGAAALSSRLKAWLPAKGTYASTLNGVQQELANDICHTVRAQIILERDENASGKSSETPNQATV
ncbi:MAG: hypothetical protein M3Y27_17200, partial [Acidobacteriota bacterium]|nr:hypothetical protein [Acidobacteriota bacterium]